MNQPGLEILTALLSALNCPVLARHLEQHGRLPHLGEAAAPWSYRGWLLPYVILSDSTVHGRWGYYLSILLRGRLPDEPIPYLYFEHSETALSVLRAGIRAIRPDQQSSETAVRRLFAWLGWGLGLVEEPPTLRESTAEELYRKLELHVVLNHPGDHLGLVLAEEMGKGQRQGTGYFPTPIDLAAAMTGFLFDDAEGDQRLLSVYEPAVGCGAHLLAASNYSLVLSGNDINPDCVLATRIQGAFYAPWLAFGLPPALLTEDSSDGVFRPPKSSPVQLTLDLGTPGNRDTSDP